jgi:hypothetical protein
MIHKNLEETVTNIINEMDDKFVVVFCFYSLSVKVKILLLFRLIGFFGVSLSESSDENNLKINLNLK